MSPADSADEPLSIRSAPGTCCPDQNVEDGVCTECHTRYVDYAVTIECDSERVMASVLKASGACQHRDELTILHTDNRDNVVIIGGSPEALARELTERTENAKEQSLTRIVEDRRQAKVDLRRAQRELER